MTVQELLVDYIQALNDDGARTDKIWSQVGHVIRLLGPIDVGELTGAMIEEYRGARRKEISTRGSPPAHSTINRELTYLRAALNRLRDSEVIDRVPKFRMRRETNVREDWCSPQQFTRILEYLAPRSPVVHDLAVWFYHTGWRLTEALGLSWSEVDLEKRELVLKPKRVKERQTRVIPLEGVLLEVIERQLERRIEGCPWVFHREGARIKSIRKIWWYATRAAGCDGNLVHGLRRTMAINHGNHRIARSVTMAIGGWKTEQMLNRYQRPTPDGIADAFRLTDDKLKEG